jgi:hypothetical protein
VARLAFLARGDHAALDAAIDACLARRERSLAAASGGGRESNPPEQGRCSHRF